MNVESLAILSDSTMAKDISELTVTIIKDLSGVLFVIVFIFIAISLAPIIVEKSALSVAKVAEKIVDSIMILLFRMIHKKGVVELEGLVGKDPAGWFVSLVMNEDSEENLNFFEKEFEACNQCSNSFEDEFSVTDKLEMIILGFLRDPDKHIYLYDYEEVLQSTYAMYQIFMRETDVSEDEFWRSRDILIERMWIDFKSKHTKKHNIRDLEKSMEIETLKKRTAEELRSLNALERYREERYGIQSNYSYNAVKEKGSETSVSHLELVAILEERGYEVHCEKRVSSLMLEELNLKPIDHEKLRFAAEKEGYVLAGNEWSQKVYRKE